ncbi:MAG: hypothetical protein IJ042_04110 [Butyricicoccus sp.]|nr:hypothetical protein [Butyricicoccus sp.]
MDLFRFASKISDASFRLSKMTSSINAFIDENSELLQKIMSGKEVPISEFLELYDTRTYNIHSRQNDIKFIKELDFKGLYVIRNLSMEKYYLGRGDHVLKKVDRHFRGYGHPDIFADYERKNKFVVYFLKLDSSGFDDLDNFEKNIRLNLKSKTTKDQYYHHALPIKQTTYTSHANVKNSETHSTEKKECNRIRSNIIVWILRLFIILFLLNKIRTYI